MNEALTYQVLQNAVDFGVRDFVICAGSRNSSFVEALRLEERLGVYYWPEERSAAFFAIGRSRLTGRPTAVITTSGTAAAELFPAAMEAHYSGDPLLLITADRPVRFRGSGAPQSAEQVHLFGKYAHCFQDVTKESPCDLSKWDKRGAAHLNVCLEEPQSEPKFVGKLLNLSHDFQRNLEFDGSLANEKLDRFFSLVTRPLVMVGQLKASDREQVANFLIDLGAPVFLESISGLRENPRLQFLRVRRTEKILDAAKEAGYEVDGILRIGGVPVRRLWRDLEYLSGKMHVCTINDLPFSGLSWNRFVVEGPITSILQKYQPAKHFRTNQVDRWIEIEQTFEGMLMELCQEEPLAEPALFHALSKIIPENAHLFLGNSLPVREWDIGAENKPCTYDMKASRSIDGIDGQISTFLGLCRPDRPNWAIVGDLTTLYDMVGFWVLSQLEPMDINLVVINNGGGQIFSRMFPHKEMLNSHNLSFEPLAKMWGLSYEKWDTVPLKTESVAKSPRLIELIPDPVSTSRFWSKLAQLGSQYSNAISK